MTTSTTTPSPTVVRHHTRANSALYFEHAFSLFGPSAAEPIILGLQNKLSSLAAVTLMDLIALSADELQLLEYDEGGTMRMLTRAQIRLAKNVQNWATHEFNRNATVGF